MNKFSTFNLATQGQQMRAAQNLYFHLSAKARKSKLPADFTAAKQALETSKHLEKEFDEAVTHVVEQAYPEQL